MASPSQLGATSRFRVTPEIVKGGATRPAKEKLGCIVLTDSPEEPTSWKCTTFLLRCRDHGFMALFPMAEEVSPVLEAFDPGENEDSVVITEIEVEFETARRRPLGKAPALIADLPWAYLPLFRRFAYKGDGPVLAFRVGGTLAKPTDASAAEASASWISEVLDEDTAHEYATAAEQEEEPELLEAAGPSQPAEVAALRARLAQLESLLANRDPPAPAPGQPSRLESLVYGGQQHSGLTPQEIEALKRAVGPPPGRLGRNEAQARGSAVPLQERTQFAEEAREVAEAEAEQDVVSALQAQLPSTPDPFQKMLILQLKQTSDLVKALAPRASADPLQAVLGGTDSGSAGSGGGSGGVKGYAARELFLKQIEDDNLVVALMRKHARQELGISEAKEEGSLMRSYLEQRIPIGDHRTMAQVGFMMAWGWEAAATTDNLQTQAFCGRMLSYVEQACLDSGRTGLAWLLTGLPEPNYQGMAVIRRRTSLTPFAKLAAPTWVAANVSYLKDIDTFETKLKTLGIPSRVPPSNDKEADNPTARPKWTKKKKGGKGGENATDDPPHA